MLFCNFNGFAGLAKSYANRDHLPDARRLRTRDDLFLLAGLRKIVQVAVGIDQHGRKRSLF